VRWDRCRRRLWLHKRCRLCDRGLLSLPFVLVHVSLFFVDGRVWNNVRARLRELRERNLVASHLFVYPVLLNYRVEPTLPPGS
jgi:hypothetical protein